MATPVLVRSYASAPAAGSGSITISTDTSGGSLLLMKITQGYQEGAPSTPTFGGSTTGIILHASISTGVLGRAWLYYLNAPTGTQDVVFAFGGYSARTVVVEVWSDTDSTTPLKTAYTAGSSTGTNPTVTVTSGAAEDVITDVLVVSPNVNPTGTISSSGSGQTTVAINDNLGTTAVNHALGASSYEAGGTSVVMNYTLDLSNRWTIIACPIAASVITVRTDITLNIVV